MKADAMTVSEIWETLDGYAEAFSRRELGKMMAFFAPDPDVVHIGTGVDEWCNGVAELQEQFERTLEQGDAIEFGFSNLQVSQAPGSETLCWIAADIVVRAEVGGRAKAFIGRATAVMEKRGDVWLFVQTHFSLPAVGQEVGRSFPDELPEEMADAA
ncbi:MAG: nuclear transport factor 2 family protein [Nitrospirae bacterium]|nr:nuclear transport factor 2 family protein [Nitrospirota bacterium]